jgi:hypothetical protein
MPNQLTSNEIITICISVAALLVSLITLYYSIFYKKIALVGCLLSWNHPYPQNDDAEKNVLVADVEFALSNTGNRELLIKEVEIDWENPPKKAITHIIFTKDLPCVLKPSQISLIRFGVPILFMKQIENLNQKLLIRFQVISPNGKLHFLSKYVTPCTGDSDWNEADWKPFTLVTWRLKSLFSRK